MSSAYLIVEKGKHRGTSIPVKGDLFLIGSDRVCQLRIDHPRVGGQHCALVTRDGKVFLRDLASGHLTAVNDREVPAGAEWPLHDGDRLLVGPLRAVVQVQETPPSQQSADDWTFKALEERGKQRVQADEGDEAAGAAAAILGRMDEQRGEVRGRLRVSIEKGVTVARLLDTQLVDEAAIDLLKRDLSERLPPAPKRVLLDFENVQRMSSMALGVLVGVNRRLKAEGGSLALCHVSRDLLPILEAVGMGKMVPSFPNKQAALAAQW